MNRGHMWPPGHNTSLFEAAMVDCRDLGIGPSEFLPGRGLAGADGRTPGSGCPELWQPGRIFDGPFYHFGLQKELHGRVQFLLFAEYSTTSSS